MARTLLVLAAALLALSACAPKPASSANAAVADSSQPGTSNSADGCVTTRDANNNVSTSCP